MPSEILLLGGTGSFGHALLDHLLTTNAERICIFSRDELKQSEMQKKYDDSRIRYFIGDVRDKDRLKVAMTGIDTVIHAAALKQVVACEYNPLEAIKTNVIGAQNVLEAAIESGVSKVLALSTDKSARPVNTYGKTKALLESIMVQGNAYASEATRCSVVRYGNVIGSRGSVIPLFRSQAKSGLLTVTDKRMTRFLITLPQAVKFVMDSLRDMQGGEIFVPKIPTARILDIAEAIAPGVPIEYTGIRPGEKLHEDLIDPHEQVKEQFGRYVVIPPHSWFDRLQVDGKTYEGGYSSDMGDKLTPEQIRGLCERN